MIGLTTLGAARVHRGDFELTDLPAQRLRFALLVYLATEGDVAREDVVAMFWPDRDTARGRHALRQMLYELRGVLGEEWLELRRDRIICNAHVDATAFEHAADAGRTTDALALYAGPFLAGFAFDHSSFEGWADRRRAHLARVHRRLQREHVAALVDAGRTEDAVGAARRWVDLDPLDDEAAHTLIERLFHAGQRTAALQYFESWQKQLAGELHVEPLDATLELVARIRNGTQGTVALTHTAQPPRRSDDASQLLYATPRPPRSPWDLAGRLRRIPRRGAAAAMVLILIASVAVALVSRLPGALRAELPRTLRVAVLALEFTDEAHANLASELGEQLTAALGQSSMLEVVSSRSIELRQADGAAATDSIGRLLSADFLLGGSIGRDGDLSTINIELFDGRDGRVIRTERLRRSQTESPALVEEAVRRLATLVREELGAQLEIQRYRVGTQNPRAWQLVLEGKAILKNLGVLFPTNELDAAVKEIVRADGLFAAAERADPRWATPVEQRARARSSQAFFMALRDPSELPRILREGLTFAERALDLDDTSAGAHEIRGIILTELLMRKLVDPDSAEHLRRTAEVAFQRAVDLEPNRQLALHHLAEFHNADGNFGEAIIAASSGYRADPWSGLASPLLVTLFAASFEAGLDQQADSWCQTGRSRFSEQPPFTSCLFEIHAWGSVDPEPDRLRRELDRIPPAMVNVQPYLTDYFEAHVAAAYARAAQTDSARAILDRLPPLPDPTDHLIRAAVHAQLGDRDTAVALLRRYVETTGDVATLRKRRFRKLNGFPAFERLLAGT